MSYSPNLTYFLDRLQGFSTNIFRLETNGADTATANKIIRFSLPSNALLNMRSFSLHFSASTNDGNGARLPKKIDTLIERVEITAGGIQLSQGLNMYNVLRHAKDAIMGDKTNSVCGHPEIIRTKSYVDGFGHTNTQGATSTLGLTSISGESYPTANKDTQFVIDQWEGFIGTCEPKIIDAAILPDLVISIYLADNNVLSSSLNSDIDTSFNLAGNGAATYTLSNIHATIESIGLADSVYDNMVSSMIAQKGYVEVPFKQYFSFNNTHSGSTRFSVATQSLDRVWVAFRATTYPDQGAPLIVAGYRNASNSNGTYLGMLDTDREKYVGKYYNFEEPAPIANGKVTYQLQLNGAYYPQFAATAEEMYAISKNSLLGSYNAHNMSLEQYKNHYFVMCARLNMPESEFSRTFSGLDTRSVSLNGYFNTFNTSGNSNIVIFCECSSSIRIGQGRMIEVLT